MTDYGVLRVFHLRNISRVRRNLDDATCAAVIRSLVTLRLDNANSLLYGEPECALCKSQVLQNDAACVLSRMSCHDHITPVLHKLHWLPLRQRISNKVLSLVYMVLRDEAAPIYLRLLLQPRCLTRVLRFSGALQLVEPQSGSTFCSGAFSVVGPRLWNHLPMDIRNVDSAAAFHNQVKTVLFCEHFEQ